MKVAVIGANGFVGRMVVPALTARGHEVLALVRKPEDYTGPGEARFADLDDAPSLVAALEGAQAVYLLTHSLGTPGFEDREATQAGALRAACDEHGPTQIIFLGGLGDDTEELSPHLRSRRAVERIVGEGRTPLTVLRAGIIIGDGGSSWEMLRQSVSNLPVIVSDPRARTSHQPIAAADIVYYLVSVLGREDCLSQTVDVGCSEVLTYREMAERVADLMGLSRPSLEIPWLPDRVAAIGIGLITDVDGQAARDLLGSMSNQTVVQSETARDLFPHHPMSFDTAARVALGLSDTPPVTEN